VGEMPHPDQDSGGNAPMTVVVRRVAYLGGEYGDLPTLDVNPCFGCPAKDHGGGSLRRI